MVEEREDAKNTGALSIGSDVPSFLSDFITADLDVQTQTDPYYGGLYKSDAVYFGTTDGEDFFGEVGD